MHPTVTSRPSHPRLFVCCLAALALFTPASPLLTRAHAQAALATDPRASQPGSVEGVLVVGNTPIAGTAVMIRETGQSTLTDKYGIYRFSAVAPGTYTLVATADGYQKLHITDVVVKPNGAMTLSQVQMHKPVAGVTELEPYVVKGEANNTIELDKYLVEGSRAKPFQDANVDIPRTINDAQPYYIFDSKTIDQSGAFNVEDFLKKRLTMNTVALNNSQVPNGVLGNSSTINLRGLGTDKTLVLVNGRRLPNVRLNSASLQPDLNGIPLSAIDRIEVLPASASGIYGGSALGGVVNVILKKAFQGGELRLTYENTWDTDAPTRTASFSYGQRIAATQTQLLVSAQWSDSKPVLLQDRRGLYERGLSIALANSPSFVFGSGILGSLPNITTFDGSPLVLKNGTSLNSSVTHVPAGTSASTPTATLNAGLLANAGTADTVAPPTYQNPVGWYRQLTGAPSNKSVRAAIQQELWPAVEANLEWSHNENASSARISPFGNSYYVTPDAVGNPFANDYVNITLPITASVLQETSSVNDSLSAGFTVKLPGQWIGEIDYTWSRNKLTTRIPGSDGMGVYNDMNAGVLNVFTDVLLKAPNWDKYVSVDSYNLFTAETLLSDYAARASGPIVIPSWGTANLTIGLEHRVLKSPENITDYVSGPQIFRERYFARRQVTDSIYGETLVPLLKEDRVPFVHALELQLAGRAERYEVDTGTTSVTTADYANYISYSGPTLNGRPFSDRTSYTSKNFTTGIRYQPHRTLTIRSSVATAFLPPTPDQLIKNPLPSSFTTTVRDPKNNNLPVAVRLLTGGNPDLQPQNSRSMNAGVIWMPELEKLKGLRVNLEYNKIRQFDAITTLSPQLLVNNEAAFPGRVTRDSTGKITLIDQSMVNAFKLETESWDLSIRHVTKTSFGMFTFDAAQSLLVHSKVQYSLTQPDYDAVGFPSEGGSAKYKANGSINWEWRNWMVGWTSTYFGSYKQWGSAGGPFSQQLGRTLPDYTDPQGSDTIPSQLYHDLVIGYSFPSRHGGSAMGDKLLSNLKIQLGVKNVFNHAPPFDAYYELYISPYGDARLRSYWVSLRKEF